MWEKKWKWCCSVHKLYLKDHAKLCDAIWHLILFLFYLFFTHRFYIKICNHFHGIYFLSSKYTAMKNILGAWKYSFSYIPFPWVWEAIFLAVWITESILLATHFNPEDGGTVFLKIFSICLWNYMVSQHRRPQSEVLSVNAKTSEPLTVN
jgi:hypothetical protein